MAKEMINNILINEGDEQKLIDRALACSAELEISEVANLVLGFFRNLPNFEMFKAYVRNFAEDEKMDLDEFLANVALSLLATLLGNFSNREKPVGKA